MVAVLYCHYSSLYRLTLGFLQHYLPFDIQNDFADEITVNEITKYTETPKPEKVVRIAPPLTFIIPS